MDSGFTAYLAPSSFMFIGLGFVYVGLRQRSTALESESWPSVEGKIVISEVVARSSGASGGYQRYYYPSVAYDYTIEERWYRGKQVTSGGEIGVSISWMAERALTRYPMGSLVRVYYNPEQPSEALLEPGMKLRILMSIAFGVIAFGCGVFLLLSRLRS